jgi:putative DNA primase/helicase
LIISNELPRLADVSGALASRFIMLILSESFYGKEDQALTGKLLTELPGILNWAITGWKRLANFGSFKQPQSGLGAIEQLEDLASPIGAFLRERCEIGQAYSVRVDGLFSAWNTWCAAQGRDHPGTKESFGRDLRAAIPHLNKTRPRDGTERDYCYEGVKLRAKW